MNRTPSIFWGIVFLAWTATPLISQENDAAAITGTWYRSNSLGQALAELAWYDRKGYEWVLKKRVSGREETLTLYKKGLEAEVRIRDMDPQGRVRRVVVLKSGQTESEIFYTPEDGKPSKETEFQDGKPTLTSEYIFGSAGLTSRIVKNAKGEELFRDLLYRMPDGRLRRVERDGPDGALAEVAWTYGSNGKISEWLRDEDLKKQGRTRVFDYETALVKENLLENMTVIMSRVVTATDAGRAIETEVLPDKKNQIKRLRDERGRLVQETVIGTEGEISSREWIYDEKDRVVRETVTVEGVTDELTYLYSKDDTEIVETRRGGVVTSRENWKSGEKQKVEIFDKGVKVLEELWENGEKTKELYYLNGEVVRERVLRVPERGTAP